MRSLVVVIAALLVVAFSLAMVSCGSGGDDTLTKAQFIKQADAICRNADKEQSTGIREAGKSAEIRQMTKAQQNELVVEVGLAPVQKEAEGISGLGAPEGDEEEVDAIVAAIEQGVREAERNPATTQVEANTFRTADRLAEAYGLEDCSEAL